MKKGYFCSEITYYQNTWRHLLVWNSNPRWCQQTWNHPSSLAISTKIILVYSRLFHELLQPIDYCLRRFKNCWNWFILRKKSLLLEVSHLSTYLVNGWNDFHQSRNEFWSELATAVTFFFSSKENSLFFSKNNHTVSLKGYITTRNTHIRQTVIVFGRICDSSV